MMIILTILGVLVILVFMVFLLSIAIDFLEETCIGSRVLNHYADELEKKWKHGESENGTEKKSTILHGEVRKRPFR